MTTGPVIGVTATSEAGAKHYVDAVERHGGTPFLILPGHPAAPDETLKRVDGLLVSGGPDVGTGSEPGGQVDESGRDAVDLPLLRAALDADLPTLGVCRGMQALNVAMGGSVLKGIEDHGTTCEAGELVSSYHRIFIAPGSKLAAIVGSGGFVRVNSRHNDGVKEPQKAPDLLASAYSLDDGVIEALESPAHSLVVGVQFHPERRMEVPPQFDRLFGLLVDRAKG